MKKTVVMITCCFVFLSVFLNAEKISGGCCYSDFWVIVVKNGQSDSTATVKVYSSQYTTLYWAGYGYYNRTLTPGTYDIYVNGNKIKSAYSVPSFYCTITCYI